MVQLRTDLSPAVRHEIERVERDLIREYRGRLPAATVRRYVADALMEMRNVRFQTFIPLLVLRSVRRRAPRTATRRPRQT